MWVRERASVARVAPTPRLWWRVSAYRADGILVGATVHRSLTAAYRQRSAMLRIATTVVVEVV